MRYRSILFRVSIKATKKLIIKENIAINRYVAQPEIVFGSTISISKEVTTLQKYSYFNMVSLFSEQAISYGAKNLLTQMLTKDPALRITAAEVECHAWVRGENMAEVHTTENVLDMMRQWRSDLTVINFNIILKITIHVSIYLFWCLFIETLQDVTEKHRFQLLLTLRFYTESFIKKSIAALFHDN